MVPTERQISVIDKWGVQGREPGWHGPVSTAVPQAQLCPPSPPQIQFVLTIIQTTCGVIWPCSFPLGWLYFQIGYMISLITLFTNFYIQVSLPPQWQWGCGLYQQRLSPVCLRGVDPGQWAPTVTVAGQPLPLGVECPC